MYAVMEVGAEKGAKKASKDSLSVDEVKFLSPLKPFTLRDGYAFEQHVMTANRNRGRDVPRSGMNSRFLLHQPQCRVRT